MDKRIKNYMHVALALALLILLFYSTQVEGSLWKRIGNTDESTASQESAADTDDGNYWDSPEALQDQFNRFGADFGAEAPGEYAQMAHAFYLEREKYQTKTAQGAVYVYDSETGTFGAYNEESGAAKAFFKPEDGQAYFDRQPGS